MTLIRELRAYTRLLWVRVLLMGLLAFLALAITQVLEPLVPPSLATDLTGAAADRLLQIIATAMLSGTIFSLTVVVTIYRSTSNQWTPRVHRLIVQDRTTQNTLAVFIGAYVYALVAIIMRELGIYVDERALVLFGMTVLVIVVIVVYLIRWVLHLQTFGSLIDTTRQIEDIARTQFQDRLQNPCMGANALVDAIPEHAKTVVAKESGYIQHIYPEELNRLAEKHGVDVYLVTNIGKFVFLNEPLLRVVERADADASDTGTNGNGNGEDEEDLDDRLRRSVVMGDIRTYDQDPRFGLIVMGEIASKSLSPGINDPGTAIDVITRIGRILSYYTDEVSTDRETALKHLFVRPLDAVDLIEDGFGALARDGRSVVEVQLRLQAILAGLMRHPDAGLCKAAQEAAVEFLRRSLQAIAFESDRERLIAAAHADVRRAVKSD